WGDRWPARQCQRACAAALRGGCVQGGLRQPQPAGKTQPLSNRPAPRQRRGLSIVEKRMPISNQAAPELQVSRWFNTPAPLSLAALRGRVVVVEAFQMLCPGCV